MSFDTVVLQLFAKLCAHGRSFSEGAFVLEDPFGNTYESLVDEGVRVGNNWCELLLRQPLTHLCSCSHCRVEEREKTCVWVKQMVCSPRGIAPRTYLLVSLVHNSAFTAAGLFDLAKAAVAGPDEHACESGGARSPEAPYTCKAWDLETLMLALPREKHASAVEELVYYNQHARLGNELFIPVALQALACGAG